MEMTYHPLYHRRSWFKWSIPKERIENGGFIGHEPIKKDLIDGVERKLVGIKPLGKLPAREGTQIFDKNEKTIGEITSGGYSLHSKHQLLWDTLIQIS